jgi:[glutamine synthetase] adenylyltransferase / [glutamine synthetase]-adenylyl-L-tyrosine phosphorylase
MPLNPTEVASILDNPQEAMAWLQGVRLVNPQRGHQNLLQMAAAGISPDLMGSLMSRLAIELPRLSDPDMALNNLDRFFQATRNPLGLAALFERDRGALPAILSLFSTSQHQSDILIADPSVFDLLRLSEGAPFPRDGLIQDLLSEVQCNTDERVATRLMLAFKRREMARIAYGDIIRGQRLETVTRQLSYLADAICESAVWLANYHLEQRYGTPRDRDGRGVGFAVMGLGKLGGLELNYSSDIDLVFLYDDDGETNGRRSISNVEYFQRLGKSFIRYLTESTEQGMMYRVDLRLRPEGSQGPIVMSQRAALQYYESKGRTWERQAWIKARCLAGDIALGSRFLSGMESWIYRRFLSRADISDIIALKRQIEQRAHQRGVEYRDVKVGHGGIRDIEFVTQFLQLLNGGELAQIRTGNTLDAIAQLELTGCLTRQERGILEENYVFLRKLEHFLQIMYDCQTHILPEDPEEIRKIAIRMGFGHEDPSQVRDRFNAALTEKRSRNRRILDHVLHDAFGDQGPVPPETDLVLMPEPPAELIQSVMDKYGFQDAQKAFDNFMSLGDERVLFLSSARCHQFLAAIAPLLLEEIATTPDPDATLRNLSTVSDSLGGKGVLWELFSGNPASMRWYVRLCAAAPYLAGILTSSPGMVDELMDSLVLDRLPSRQWIATTLDELCRGAEDIDPILHGFKNSLHLRVGVRDVLGKETIEATTETLAEVAENLLQQVALFEYQRLVQKLGTPRMDADSRRLRLSIADLDEAAIDSAECVGLDVHEDECELMILGMGKLGGREPNYHSDLDVIFLYEADGNACRRRGGRLETTTTNQHFFSELAQRVMKTVTKMGPWGRLYEMDPRLRPAGRSGPLAVSLDEFAKYFADGRGQLWERQALCKARPVFGSNLARRRVTLEVQRAIRGVPWDDSFAQEIAAMRAQMQATASPQNLKRGAGGTVDIEFLVQALQLQHARQQPEVLETGTLQAIAKLSQLGHLPELDAIFLRSAYQTLRGVEARLRLMNTSARHELPEDPKELAKLAYLLHRNDPAALVRECEEVMQRVRETFRRYVR